MPRPQLKKRVVVTLVVIALMAAAVYLFYTELRPVVIFGLRDDFAHAIPSQRIPAGLTSIRAEECGQCHREIYEEWKSSIHAQAFVDPFFQAFWKKDKHIWICLNCHTPLENQQPELILEIPRNRVEKAVKKPNPNYDPDFRLEGITCAACHVRDGVILGPFDDSVAPHPTRYDPMYRTTETCYRCHQVPSGPFQFYRFGPCGTYPEYEGGPYYKAGYICQTCHMPEVERPVAAGGPIRKGRRHLWRGGHDPEQLKRAVTVRLQADPADIAPGTDAQFTLTLTNSGAGHYLPTGDPDRYFTVEFQILDHQDKILKEQTHTIGRWILWQPVIWEIYGNRVQPLESREYAFHYRLPASAERTSRLRFRTVIRYHIQTEKVHEMLKSRYSLTADDPYTFTIFEHEAPLPGAFTTVLQQGWKHDIPEKYLMSELACVDRVPTTGTPLARLFDPEFSY
ncbi:MAG: hypothetical protein HY207_02960 [Nitrospirae bacterium]|nr:hypothetical protein [Nitrospirota bacterium]